MLSKNNSYDVIVVGGGPAGMIAAGRTAEQGRSVLLLEKNPTLGKKLLLTGNGRCNLTNNQFIVRELLAQYKGASKFLFSAFAQFGVDDTIKFFNKHGVATKTEDNGRVFPVSNKAQTVLDALIDYLKEGKVEVRTNIAVADLTIGKDKKFVITLKDKTKIKAMSVILATGGIARPDTGSTGEGFSWLKKLGHKIIKPRFSLVPIVLEDSWVKDLSGLTVGNIKLTTFQNNEKQKSYSGDLLFTHFGISGQMVLNMSSEVGALLEKGKVQLSLDLFPKLDLGALKEKLQALLTAESNKEIKNTLSKLIPERLALALLKLAKIKIDTPNHSVRSEQRKELILLMKNILLNVKGLLGAEAAMASTGGVALEEVDMRTMQSRVVEGLYFVGDVLNVDRPTGGYSLQLGWTTGFVAGDSVGEE